MSYRIPAYVHHRTVDNEVVLFDGQTETYLGLNSTGAIVWTVLVAGNSTRAAADALIEDTGVAPDVALADTVALADELVRRGLLEPAKG